MFSMFSHAEEYALKPINSHLFSNGILIKAGSIVDINGVKLAYTENNKRKYAENPDARAALLHILGDDKGFISGGIQDTFREELCGYSIFYGVNKIYSNTLKLTLDSELCAKAYEALKPYKGVIAVCDYKTGEIVCLATSPSYDVYNVPKDLNDNEKYEGVYINRLFGGLYTPGSTFKTVTSLAAVENIGDINERKFYCSGSYKKNGMKIICNDVHGSLSFKEALNKSCNVVFAQIAVELGEEKMESAFKAAGLDKKYQTSDRITTKGGVTPFEKEIDKNELGWAGIGQSTVLVNPYAFLTFMCAIANGGKATEPYFVKSAENEDGKIIYEPDRVDSGLNLNPDSANELKELLRSDVRDYYGDRMFGSAVMCGKTGTAEIDGKKAHSLFVGFSYDESFPYAIVTVMENAGSGLGKAGRTSANIMKELYSSRKAS